MARSKASPVLAVDLGGTKIAASLVDDEGVLLARPTEPVDTSSPAPPVRQIVGLPRFGGDASLLGAAHIAWQFVAKDKIRKPKQIL
jgi:hypothetical protein